jgi:hypothetical protein
MAKAKVKKTKAPSFKKVLRQQISDKLRTALTELEEKVSKKDLESRIKKAAKLLTAGVKNKALKVKAKPVKEEVAVTEEKPA